MTRFCIALMFQNEAEWLRLHLSVITRGAIDGLVGLDGGSTDDSAAVFKSFGGVVYTRPFDFDFGAQANALLDAAIDAGYDAILRLDPDELIFPEHIARVRGYLEHYPVVSLPRFNFARTRVHYVPEWYPDPQFRGMRLDKGIRYGGKVHEGVTPLDDARFIPGANLYHYSGVRGDMAGRKRAALYTALGKGEKADWSIPPMEWSYPNYTRWPVNWEQPLDPYEVGIHAPYDHAPHILTTPNLGGDRGIEYGWCEQHLPTNGLTKTVLDLGSAGHSHLATVAVQRGYRVTALDQQPFTPPPGVIGIVGDMRTVKGKAFDVVLNCSTVEHVGLAGRYGVTEDDSDGDLQAMQNLRHMVKPDGVMLLTIPVGRDYVHRPLHRVYGRERLPRLLEGYEVVQSAYYLKRGDQWCEVAESEALNTYTVSLAEDWRSNYLALGGFVLRAAV